jgi:WS/DGAT/MGAT family acyltransferase
MWRASREPARRLTVGALLLLDHPVDRAKLLGRLQALVDQNPRLHWVPDDPTFSQTRPVWVEEDEPDAGRHFRSIEVAPPGTERELLDLVALLDAVPFEQDQSPWDATFLTGLDDGGVALYLRAHHVLTDGFGGVRLLHGLVDGAASLKASSQARRHGGWMRTAADGDKPRARVRRPGTFTVEIDLTEAVHSVSDRIGGARDVQPLQMVIHTLQKALDVVNSVSRQVMVAGGPLSPVPPSRSILSQLSILSVPGAQRAACELGGSRNDLLVLAAAAATGLYYEHSGQECPNVRVAMPAHQHRDDDWGNWFAPARVEIPCTSDHPQRQFGIVRERLAQARHEPALRLTAALASSLSRLPNRLLLPAIQAQLETIDLAVTAIPGLHGSPTLCGAAIKRAYPMGPRLGIPLNITAFGNNGRLDIGIAVDPAAITDPGGFHDCLIEVLDQLVPTQLTPVVSAD